MTKKIIWIVLILMVGSLSFSVLTEEKAKVGKDVYICPMECKKLHFDKPGTCPVCGMDLVKQAEFIQNDKRKGVAILLFDGVQIIDFSAPYEVFGQADFKVVTVAAKKAPVVTSMNLTVTPDFDFQTAPAPDILVVPGGAIDSALNDSATIEWIRKNSVNAQHVLSVCNGAFILGKAGLLDGLKATTFYRLIDQLAQQSPKTDVVRDQRFVDNGKVITTAGLTSGMDGSLHVVSKVLGKGEAQRIALHLEYNWQPEGKFARASLADMQLPNVDFPQGTRVTFLRTEGTTDRWEVDLAINTDMTRQELEKHIATNLETNASWKQQNPAQNPAIQNWTFSGRDGRAWRAAVKIEDSEAGKNTYVLKVELNRAA
jgi:transcriptional regulator GlxA family with amidase domain